MKKIITALLICVLGSTTSFAATTKATPKPTTKATTKATSTKKPVIKHRTYVRKKVTPSPSPKPVWPPKGFIENNGVYARVPSGSELVGLLSAKTTLAKTVQACEASACGAVYVASNTSCSWWEITSTVYGPSYADITNYIPFGTLRTLVSSSESHVIVPVFLVSTEPLIPNEQLILQTLNISRDKFYNLITQGQSLRQIAGAKINAVVSAVTSAEKHDISVQLASGSITSAQAQDEIDGLPARVSNELTSYNLTVGGINVKCWITPGTETVPSTTYTPQLVR